ncbi:MAG: glycoside hydrolase family protein [Anaerolineae bacterium]
MKYPDGRPEAVLRLPARDQGVILSPGGAPGGYDDLCVREAIINRENGLYYLFYDGASEKGWVVNLAVSADLQHWEKKGPLLEMGRPGEGDRHAVSPWVIREGGTWHMFYIGGVGEGVPTFPYLTFKASSQSLAGPWIKQPEVVPFRTRPGTYYSVTASAGHIIRDGGEYLQFFSATTRRPGHPYVLRTLGLARTTDLDGPWTLDPEPILPVDEQIENSSLYYEPASKLWFLFTNHIGVEPGLDEYTDAAWVYWSPDLRRWDPRNKAVVLDGANCSWSQRSIGMPSVLPVGGRLAVFYDAPGGTSTSHWGRSIGLAWLDLPLAVPSQPR